MIISPFLLSRVSQIYEFYGRVKTYLLLLLLFSETTERPNSLKTLLGFGSVSWYKQHKADVCWYAKQHTHTYAHDVFLPMLAQAVRHLGPCVLLLGASDFYFDVA